MQHWRIRRARWLNRLNNADWAEITYFKLRRDYRYLNAFSLSSWYPRRSTVLHSFTDQVDRPRDSLCFWDIFYDIIHAIPCYPAFRVGRRNDLCVMWRSMRLWLQERVASDRAFFGSDSVSLSKAAVLGHGEIFHSLIMWTIGNPRRLPKSGSGGDLLPLQSGAITVNWMCYSFWA